MQVADMDHSFAPEGCGEAFEVQIDFFDFDPLEAVTVGIDGP